MEKQEHEELVQQLLMAACQVLKEKLQQTDISDEFVSESYMHVKRVLSRGSTSKIPEYFQNPRDAEKFLADDLALAFYMTAVVHSGIKSFVTPETIQYFRQAVLSVLRPSLEEDNQ